MRVIVSNIDFTTVNTFSNTHFDRFNPKNFDLLSAHYFRGLLLGVFALQFHFKHFEAVCVVLE